MDSGGGLVILLDLWVILQQKFVEIEKRDQSNDNWERQEHPNLVIERGLRHASVNSQPPESENEYGARLGFMTKQVSLS